MKKTLAILLGVVMIAGILAGCGVAQKSEEAYDMAPADHGGMNNEAKGDQYYTLVTNQEKSGGMPVPGPMDDENFGYYEEGRKTIKTGNAELEVKNYQEAYDTIKQMLGNSGYIEESSIWKTPVYVNGEKMLLTNGSIRLRIKAEAFQDFADGLDAVGTVLSSVTSEDDISDMYYDTEGRLELLRDEKERLEAYADTVEDYEVFFEIQSRITQVIYEMENLQGTLKKWDSKVEFATIYITINEENPNQGPVLPEPRGFFGKIWDNMKDGVSFLGDVIIFLAGALPILLVLAAVAIIIIIVVKRLSHRTHRKPPVDKNPE